MTENTTKVAAQMVARSIETYTFREERAALRCALGDAAHLCYAVGRDILAEGKTRGGKGPPSIESKKLAMVAKRCGDAILAMRNLVEVPK